MPGDGGRGVLRRAASAAALASLLVATGLAAQQDGEAPADTAPPPDTTEAAADTAQEEARTFPRLRAGTDSVSPGDVHRWSRKELLDSSALTVADFLTDHLPGVLPLRANLHFGPHQLVDGLLGPGAVRVVVDGRELPMLESAQADLARIPLARTERLEVVRRAGEIVVSVTTPRHDGGEAYSRISGGTGQPSAQLIRGVFTNGAGQDFAVAAALDHLDVGAGPGPGNRLDAWGKLSWMPFDDRSGVELLWHSDALDRIATLEESFGRSEVLLHGRVDVSEGLQIDVWGGRISRDPGFTEAGTSTNPPATGLDEEDEPVSYDVAHAELGVTGSAGPVAVEGGARVRDGAGLPTLEAELRTGVRLAPGLSVHAAGELGSWDAFTVTSYSGGVTYRTGLPGDLVLRAEAATGDRGLARPGRAADSLAVDALAGAAEAQVGPYRLEGRLTRRTAGAQMPFGGHFDRDLAPGPEATVLGAEGSVTGPLVPMEVLEERLRVEGWWRRSDVDAGPLPLYVPRDVARGELRFQDTYYGGNLEVRASAALRYRGPMRTARPGDPEPVVVPGESVVDTEVVIRIDTFRIWWRVDNARRSQQRDFADLPFPSIRNVVGISWVFFD